MKRRMMAMILMVVLVGAVTSCASKESTVTGKWLCQRMQGGKIVYVTTEFFSDKTVAMKTPERPMSGKWSILSDGRIKADMDDIFFNKQIILGELEGDRLILEIDGKKMSFHKM